MIVKNIMSTDVLTLPDSADVNLAQVMAELKQVRHLPVVNSQGLLTGIVSVKDMLCHFAEAGASHFIPVKDIMTQEVVTVKEDDELKNAVKLMREHNISALPVVEQDKIIGMLTDRDFLKLVEYV